jgi:hypothetical protein
MKRWQLLVYFQLRFREIVKDVEQELDEKNKNIFLSNADLTKGK